MDWDLSAYFDSHGSASYESYKQSFAAEIGDLERALAKTPPLSPETVEAWVGLVADYEQVITRGSHLTSYVSCLVSADAANEAYADDEAWLGDLSAGLTKLHNGLITGLGAASDGAFQALLEHPKLEEAAFALAELREEAGRRMSEPEESLAADLAVTGIHAWSRLYFTLVGKLRFTVKQPDGSERLVPYAQRMTLLSDPDRGVRRAAFEGANAALAEHETTFASALNAISGERLTLFRRRGVDHFLDEACRQARLTRRTLDALMSAIAERYDSSREILRFRNTHRGISDPAFYDIYAPLSSGDEAEQKLSWEQGVALIEGAFRSAYPELGAFFRTMVDQRWIDYSPRDNKRPGGFCTTSQQIRESRIFMTYQGTMNENMTLAHEAGHAWHSHVLNRRRALAADYPMTLAESASTFAEMILSEGVMENGEVTDAQKLAILDADTERVSSFLLDIPMRFHFEKALYEERAQGSLSVSRIKQLMTETQRSVFGGTLAPGGEDPYFWASKLHFYVDDVSFYNYPYAFGYLLSLSLFARFRQEGKSFLPAYERFLAETGMKSCEEVIRDNLGEDIGDPAFWTRAIDEVQRPYGRLKELLGK